MTKKLLTALFAATACTAADGATIVSYDLTGDAGNAVTEPAYLAAAGVTGLPLARGAGLTASSGTNSFNASSWNSTAASAAEDTEYFSFGFTLAPGVEADLDELIIATKSSNTGPGTLGLYYSGDGYTSLLTSFTQPGDAFLNSIVDLSSLSGLTGTVEFRIIEIGNLQADGDGETTSGGTFRIAEYDTGATENRYVDVAITGSVPEPASLAVLGLGGMALLTRRRRGR